MTLLGIVLGQKRQNTSSKLSAFLYKRPFLLPQMPLPFLARNLQVTRQGVGGMCPTRSKFSFIPFIKVIDYDHD
jgi:hypothetical protein